MKFDCGGGIQHSFASNRFYVTIQLNKLKSEAKLHHIRRQLDFLNMASHFYFSKILRFLREYILQKQQIRRFSPLQLLAILVNKRKKSRGSKNDLVNWGSWGKVQTCKDRRFKREIFNFVVNGIREKLERKTTCEDPIFPEFRLAISLYRLGRDDYFYTILEIMGVGLSTVSAICKKVNSILEERFWLPSVQDLFAVTENNFREIIGRLMAVSLSLGYHWWLPHTYYMSSW